MPAKKTKKLKDNLDEKVLKPKKKLKKKSAKKKVSDLLPDQIDADQTIAMVETESAESEPTFTAKELKKKKKVVTTVPAVSIAKQKDEIEMYKDKEDRITRPDEAEIDKELNDIYGTGDGSLPDMSRFEKKKRSSVFTALMVLIFSCAVLAAVAWLGFFVFQPQSRFSEEDVILTIAGDENILAGQEVHYRVRYRNAQNIPLAQVNLQVRYPEGFVFEKSEPASTVDTNDEWALGALEEQASGYIDIWGKLYGSLEGKQSFRGFLNYTPSNFNSEFQKVATLSTQVDRSPVELLVGGQTRVTSGAETELTVKLKNQHVSSTENLALVLEPGDNFQIRSSEPVADESNQYRWTIDEIEDELEIKIVGVFSDSLLDDKAKITFNILNWKDNSRSGTEYVIATQVHEVEITKTEVLANLIINGSSSNFSAQPGDVLSASIVVQNNSGSVVRNAVVTALFDAPSADNQSLLNWGELEDGGDGRVRGEQISPNVRRGEIEWTARNYPGLASLDPGEEVVIDFSLPIKSVEDTDLTQFETFEIMANVNVDYQKDGEDKDLAANQIKILVNSDVNLEVQDSVNESDGKVVHTITWLLSNTFHELRDIKMEADFFGEISVPESNLVVPAGSASYDETKDKMAWTIDVMPTSVDVLALRFDVIIEENNPTRKNLSSQIKFSARDTVTGEDIILAGDEVLLNSD